MANPGRNSKVSERQPAHRRPLLSWYRKDVHCGDVYSVVSVHAPEGDSVKHCADMEAGREADLEGDTECVPRGSNPAWRELASEDA